MISNREFDPWESFTVQSQYSQPSWCSPKKASSWCARLSVTPEKDQAFDVIYPGEIHERNIKGDIEDK